jgi:hypothetical protein
MEKTKDDGQWSAYSDSLRRRNRTMRDYLEWAPIQLAILKPTDRKCRQMRSLSGSQLLHGPSSPLYRGIQS